MLAETSFSDSERQIGHPVVASVADCRGAGVQWLAWRPVAI
jgi:hypothetical protein